MGYSDETEAEEESAADSARLKVGSSVSESAILVRPAQLWKRALKKLQSVDLDPWLDFQTHSIPTHAAVRHRYSVIKKKWIVDKIWVKIECVPFDRGAMRECFRLKKLPQSGSHANDWQYASNYVAKRYITNVDKQVYFDDVRLQMEAKLWGEAFNRQNPPKKVDIFQLSVLELHSNSHSSTVRAEESDSSATSIESSSFYHIERYMEGEYRKYNSNSGFVDEQLRNTPQAFSHFTFERSGHRLLVVDIQGVGDLYTDPQIHTSDGVGYSDGNLGPRGMALFFHSHRCNPLCEWLGLTPFDLAESELHADVQSSVSVYPHEDRNGSACECPFKNGQTQEPKHETDHPEENGGDCKTNQAEVVQPNVIAMVRSRVPPRRRAMSFSQSITRGSSRFGPTVARSTDNMQHAGAKLIRRRSESQSISSDEHPPSSAGFILFNGSSLSNLLDPEDEVASVGPFATLKLDTMVPVIPNSTLPGPSNLSLTPPLGNPSSSESHFPRSMLAFDPFPVSLSRRTRDRAASGDSGYSGPGLTNSALQSSLIPHILPHIDPSSTAALIRSGLEAGSVSSLVDYSVPASPVGPPVVYQNQFGMPASSHSLYTGGVDELLTGWTGVGSWNHGWNYISGARMASVLPRRRRNLSESSDLDFDDEHRMTGNLLHQLMHENHKPSSADHPTNLDQEIGQSILGQIHHELARLHEAGRFLPNCKGGWSHAGIGGLLLKNHNLDDPDEVCDDHEHNPDNNDYRNGLSNYELLTMPPEHSIDWAAVLFHERHAAQLGCLEAMIVMAHYYLGLPTQLMLDCPIKPNQSDLRSGVDYLGRAAEGGDRRCMILLARFLDVSASLSDPTHAVSKITRPDDFLLLPALTSANRDAVPLISSDPWIEAVAWYKKAVDTAGASASGDGVPDEGLDAEGRYDAAEDLLPVYRILARMAEMYSIGGFGLKQDSNMAGDLFTQAGELASAVRQGRLAATYFELGEEAYAKCE